SQEAAHAHAVRLMTAAFILTGLRVHKEDLPTIYDGVRVMHESTAYDQFVDEGKVFLGHRILLRLGRKQFGEPDAQAESALAAIQDPDRLERMAEAVLTAHSWQELLGTP